MCGIMGYVGPREAQTILIEGLKRLEYRGYDSAGIGVLDGTIQIEKVVGTKNLKVLEQRLAARPMRGRCGIAHTRWATHGEPSEENAHPHTDCGGKLLLVHNGIIENFDAAKRYLETTGHTFSSQTDAEVIAHSIEAHYCGDLVGAVRSALGSFEGTWGLAVMHVDHPNEIVCARWYSPLVIGVGIGGEYFVASDKAPLRAHTNDLIFLKDRDLVLLTPDGPQFSTMDNADAEVEREVEHDETPLDGIELEGHETFMHQEIFVQPSTIAEAIRGHLTKITSSVHLSAFTFRSADEYDQVRRFILVGCGTSWHAGLYGEFVIESLARIPVETEIASEFHNSDPPFEPGTRAICISQSGETIDTLRALRMLRRREVPVYGIVNVVGSTIAREAGQGVYLHAGPEIGVASTKAFTSQATILFLIALLFAQRRGRLTEEESRRYLEAIERLPDQVARVLELEDRIRAIAAKYRERSNFLYLGRGPHYPVALEGALKLKELAYVGAQGYPAGEMKHGPIALLEEGVPVIVVSPRGAGYERMRGNVEEVKARRGQVIAVVTRGDRDIAKQADHVIEIPMTEDLLAPILSVVPLQLFAYHVARQRGCDVDRPRNLAKSVTVD